MKILLTQSYSWQLEQACPTGGLLVGNLRRDKYSIHSEWWQCPEKGMLEKRNKKPWHNFPLIFHLSCSNKFSKDISIFVFFFFFFEKIEFTCFPVVTSVSFKVCSGSEFDIARQGSDETGQPNEKGAGRWQMRACPLPMWASMAPTCLWGIFGILCKRPEATNSTNPCCILQDYSCKFIQGYSRIPGIEIRR